MGVAGAAPPGVFVPAASAKGIFMPETFLGFIKKNSKRNDPIGDYCSDTIRVINMYPDKNRRLKYKKDFAALFNLVSPYHVCEEARQAFKDAWAEYKNG